MELNKVLIEKALVKITLPGEGKPLLESGCIKNIQLFGDEVFLDIEIENPTLQFKKKVEQECIKAIHSFASEKARVKVNFIIKKPEKSPKIKGEPIPGVKNIIAISSGKGGVGK